LSESRFERLCLRSHALLGRCSLARDVSRRLSWLPQYLELLDFRLPHDYYVSFSLLTSASAFASALLLSLLLYVFVLRVPLYFSIASSLLLALIIGMATFGSVIFYPALKRREIRSKMESGALFAIITLTSSAASSLNLIESLAISERLITNKEIKSSFRRILKRFNEGMDLRDSLIRESELVPSKTFSVLYEGLASISVSGVGLVDFLNGFLEDLLSTMDSKVRNVIDRLGVLVETYIIIAVIFPFLLVIMLIMTGSSGGAGSSISQTILLFDIALLPSVFVVLLLLTDLLLREVSLD